MFWSEYPWPRPPAKIKVWFTVKMLNSRNSLHMKSVHLPRCSPSRWKTGIMLPPQKFSSVRSWSTIFAGASHASLVTVVGDREMSRAPSQKVQEILAKSMWKITEFFRISGAFSQTFKCPILSLYRSCATQMSHLPAKLPKLEKKLLPIFGHTTIFTSYDCYEVYGRIFTWNVKIIGNTFLQLYSLHYKNSKFSPE